MKEFLVSQLTQNRDLWVVTFPYAYLTGKAYQSGHVPAAMFCGVLTFTIWACQMWGACEEYRQA